jgi:hypothetical protein
MSLNIESGGPAETKSFFKSPTFYTSLAILIIAVYVSYVLLARYESNRKFVQRIEEKQAASQRESDRNAVEQLGGSELAIRSMYISPGEIHRGESAQLCYDVSNAKTVTLDPPEAEVWPSHSRCVNLSPKKTTSYTLTIRGASGDPVTQSVELKVH